MENSEEESGDETKDRSAMRYRKQRRGGKGLRDIRTSERNGCVVRIASVRDGDEVMLITQQGMVNRIKVAEVRVVGRNTQGVRLIHLNEGDRVATIAKLASEDLPETPIEEPLAATSTSATLAGDTESGTGEDESRGVAHPPHE